MCVHTKMQRLIRGKLDFWKVLATSGPGGRVCGASSYCMNLCLPWALPCVTGRRTFAPQRHISALEGLPLQRAGGWKQKENSLGKKCPTQGPDLAHLESPLSPG